MPAQKRHIHETTARLYKSEIAMGSIERHEAMLHSRNLFWKGKVKASRNIQGSDCHWSLLFLYCIVLFYLTFPHACQHREAVSIASRWHSLSSSSRVAKFDGSRSCLSTPKRAARCCQPQRTAASHNACQHQIQTLINVHDETDCEIVKRWVPRRDPSKNEAMLHSSQGKCFGKVK